MVIALQRLDGQKKVAPVLHENPAIGHNLPVCLDVLACMKVDGHIEAIGDIELDDIQEPAFMMVKYWSSQLIINSAPFLPVPLHKHSVPEVEQHISVLACSAS